MPSPAAASREADAPRLPERPAPIEGVSPTALSHASDMRDAHRIGHARFIQALGAIERSTNIPSGAFSDERLQQAAANLA